MQTLTTSKIARRFGVSADWFRDRIGKVFHLGEHFYQPEPKGTLFWDVQAVENYIISTIPTPSKTQKHSKLINNLLK